MMFRWRHRKPAFLSGPRDPAKTYVSRQGKSVVEIGRYTYGIEHMQVREWGEGANLKIGAFCSIARDLRVFLGGNHRTDWATTFPFGHVFKDSLGAFQISGHPQTNGDVVIGNDVWLGECVTLLSGITIADGTVVAANSTLTKSTQPYEVWGGHPARLIHKRFDDAVIGRLLELRWWELPVERIRKIAPLLSQPPTLDLLASLSESLPFETTRT
jgi:chloramphenicol O-acetyltransferase type B